MKKYRWENKLFNYLIEEIKQKNKIKHFNE